MHDELVTLPWVILGAGRVGRTLGFLARELGIQIDAIWNRTSARAEESASLLGLSSERACCGDLRSLSPELFVGRRVIWLTVVDDHLAASARALAAHDVADAIVLHTAGSLSSDVLRGAGLSGELGSLHPLQAMSDPREALAAMRHCVWTVEGDPLAVGYARWLMGNIGVTPLDVEPQTKVLYHASAVTIANLMVALVDASYEMAGLAGISRDDARDMLLPLATSSLDNLRKLPPREALTGPVARGDDATIQRHAEALAAASPELLELYEVLTRRARALMQRE